MAKMFVFQIAYRNYALPMEQAMALLTALEPAREVKREVHNSPYIFVSPDSKDAHAIVTGMSLAECLEPTTPETKSEPLSISTPQPSGEADNDIPF